MTQINTEQQPVHSSNFVGSREKIEFALNYLFCLQHIESQVIKSAKCRPKEMSVHTKNS